MDNLSHTESLSDSDQETAEEKAQRLKEEKDAKDEEDQFEEGLNQIETWSNKPLPDELEKELLSIKIQPWSWKNYNESCTFYGVRREKYEYLLEKCPDMFSIDISDPTDYFRKSVRAIYHATQAGHTDTYSLEDWTGPGSVPYKVLECVIGREIVPFCIKHIGVKPHFAGMNLGSHVTLEKADGEMS